MKTIGKVFVGIIYALLYAPMAVMVLFSFNASDSTTKFSGFSFRWYENLVNDYGLRTVLGNTIKISLTAAVIATILGVIAAYGIFGMKSKALKNAANTVTNIPLTNPDIITGVSLMLLFTFVGVWLGGSATILGFWTLLIAHITFDLPYVILNVLPKLYQTDRSLYEAALDLGCTPRRAFWKVIFPAITPGILSGFIMAFTLSLDDFIISYYTNGHFNILATQLYTAVKKPLRPTYYALYTLIFLAILALMTFVNVMQIRSEKQKQMSKTGKRILLAVIALILVCTVVLSVTASGRNDTLQALRDELEPELEGDYTNDLAGTTLYVYNWGEYISDGEDDSLDVNLAFEAVTGIHVEYSTFDSNESMYSTLIGGGVTYDVIIPSDYMISRLIKENRLKKIDYTTLSNYQYIDERYRVSDYDPTGEYSIPYAGGYLGVIYNNTMVDEADVDGTWSLLWNEKYKGQILGIDNARDAFAAAQYALGLDVNSVNYDDWDKAAQKLMEQTPLLQGRVMDQIFAKMQGENAAIAYYYAGDYLTMVDAMDESGVGGDHLSFYLPSEGTNIFFDAMCIPEGCQNYEAALLYLNFMMEPYVSWQNAEYICYTCPNTAVMENEEYSLQGNEFLYPEGEVKASYYTNLPDDVLKYYEKLWNKVKSSS
ncbi:MAG: extracellular solute-binding protein [Clostridiales bacterium]|nr:extracellular solute-binding protein [Candidatus Coliplasma caballi]